MRRGRAGRSSWLAALVLLVSRAALACPACAGRNDGGAPLFFVYVVMVAAPFIAVALAFRSIKRLAPLDSLAGDQPRSTAPPRPRPPRSRP